MKRAYPANVDGQIFYIDDDAFQLLQNYLHQLKVTFSSPEGEEIVGDIESRIRELFAEKVAAGSAVMTMRDVESVIETMGRPEDISDACGEPSAAPYEDFSDTGADGEEYNMCDPRRHRSFENLSLPDTGKQLYRNMDDKVLGGVFGGLAVMLGWNANLMRLLYLILTVCTYFWPCIILYLVAWMIIPPASTPRQKLRMRGEPVNVDTVGQTVISDCGATPPPVEDSGNIFTNAFILICKCFLAVVGFVSGIAFAGISIFFFFMLVAVIAFCGFNSVSLLAGLPMGHDYALPVLMLILVGSLLGAVITFMITWGCVSFVFSTGRMSKSTILTFFITIMILAAATCVLAIFANF